MGEENGGKPLLILHGWGSSTKSWEKVQHYLARYGYKVIVPDMPGFGGSDSPPKAWHGDDYLAWLLNFIETQKLETPLNIVGHSFGGGLAMKLAIEYPKLVKNLILVSAARIYTKHSLYKRIVKKIAQLGRKMFYFMPFFSIIRKIFYRLIVGEKDYMRAEGVMRETMKLIIREDLTPELHKIQARTLIIWGTKDKATPIENAHLINEKVPGSELETIDGAGHALNLECPEKLAQMIGTYLNNIPETRF